MKHRIDGFDSGFDLGFDISDLESWFSGSNLPALYHSNHLPTPSAPPQLTIHYRSIDGSGNNLTNPSLNAAGTDFARIGPANFADGIGTMVDGPNTRMISNVVVAGNGDLPNPQGLSGMMYAWGQFIDHDLDRSDAGGADISIHTPANDPVFPGGVIGLTRAQIDPNTGEGTGKPATAVNEISGWLDASMVYGSDAATAASLRLADGHMKTSAGNNLPIDPQSGMFMAGDVRAAENPDLTALQTLFVREHNYQVDALHKAHPTWTGEQLYQQAKAIVTAEIENITYSEFLPHLLGTHAIAPYHGYNPHVDPTITEEFAGAAYRFGHSIVSAEIGQINEQGEDTAAQDLKDAFFETASTFVATGDADGLLRHLSGDLSNALDVHIVDDLRNFLFDPPDGMDLAAINIQRGRDLGLGTLNETREALGLKPYTSFDQLTDPATAAAMKVAYGGDIDAVDLWTGGLAENHAPGAMVGQTFQKIIAMQFEALRDGDRLWFEHQGFDPKTLNQIENTTLADIIARDTDTANIQSDVFVYYDRHSGTAGGGVAENPSAPQLVIGSNGVDTLVGGPKNDILVAGTGKQTLTGGAGADEFHFGKGVTNATITDFKPGQDKLVFDGFGGLSYKDVHVGYDHGKVVVQVGNDHIELVGLHQNQLSAHDYLLQA